MKRIVYLLIVPAFFSCQNAEKGGEQLDEGKNSAADEAPSEESATEAEVVEDDIPLGTEKIELTEPTIIAVKFDSIEMDDFSEKEGSRVVMEDVFYYHMLLEDKMKPLGIPILKSESESIAVLYGDSKTIISKDSSFSIYTYFHYDGERLERKEVLELLEKE